MKLIPLPARAVSFAALFASVSSLAQAHPGHSAVDWFSRVPHAGHGEEYAVILATLVLIVFGCSAYWLASRKR